MGWNKNGKKRALDMTITITEEIGYFEPQYIHIYGQSQGFTYNGKTYAALSNEDFAQLSLTGATGFDNRVIDFRGYFENILYPGDQYIALRSNVDWSKTRVNAELWCNVIVGINDAQITFLSDNIGTTADLSQDLNIEINYFGATSDIDCTPISKKSTATILTEESSISIPLYYPLDGFLLTNIIITPANGIWEYILPSENITFAYYGTLYICP